MDEKEEKMLEEIKIWLKLLNRGNKETATHNRHKRGREEKRVSSQNLKRRYKKEIENWQKKKKMKVLSAKKNNKNLFPDPIKRQTGKKRKKKKVYAFHVLMSLFPKTHFYPFMTFSPLHIGKVSFQLTPLQYTLGEPTSVYPGLQIILTTAPR